MSEDLSLTGEVDDTSSAEPSAPTPRLRWVPSPRPPSDTHR